MIFERLFRSVRPRSGGSALPKWLFSSLLLLLTGAPASAWAGCFATGLTSPEIGTVQLSGTVVVPRDAPVGTELARFLWTNPFPHDIQMASCEPGPYSVEYAVPVAPYAPATNGVYPTNVAGVGVQVKTTSGRVFPQTVNGDTGPSGAGVYNSGSGAYYIFVKTGPVTGGAVTGVDVPTVTLTYLSSAPIYRLSGAGSITFTAASCVTPDVVVDLGHHLKNEFTGAGYTTANADFNIQLNNCPAGMNSIKYRIDPVTTVQVPAQSVVALDATSTASGVGVQLLTNSGGAHPLGAGTDQALTSYIPTTGGDYTIPLRARYYQTGASVTPGLANTTMMFTMTYQ